MLNKELTHLNKSGSVCLSESVVSVKSDKEKNIVIWICCYISSGCSLTCMCLFALFAQALITKWGIMKDSFIRLWPTFLDAMCHFSVVHWHMAGVECVWLWRLSFLKSPAALLSLIMNRFSQNQLWRHETHWECWMKTNNKKLCCAQLEIDCKSLHMHTLKK